MAASPPISGRDISALAVVRRPSWNMRSSSFDVAGGGHGGHPLVGYSVSPLADGLGESSLLSASTPRHYGTHPHSAGGPAAGNFSPITLPAAALSGNSFSSGNYGPPRIALRGSADAEIAAAAAEESESYMLPFALDGEASPLSDPLRPSWSGGTEPGKEDRCMFLLSIATVVFVWAPVLLVCNDMPSS